MTTNLENLKYLLDTALVVLQGVESTETIENNALKECQLEVLKNSIGERIGYRLAYRGCYFDKIGNNIVVEKIRLDKSDKIEFIGGKFSTADLQTEPNRHERARQKLLENTQAMMENAMFEKARMETRDVLGIEPGGDYTQQRGKLVFGQGAVVELYGRSASGRRPDVEVGGMCFQCKIPTIHITRNADLNYLEDSLFCRGCGYYLDPSDDPSAYESLNKIRAYQDKNRDKPGPTGYCENSH